jgi:hypothetical protein
MTANRTCQRVTGRDTEINAGGVRLTPSTSTALDPTRFSVVDYTADPDFYVRFMEEGHRLPDIVIGPRGELVGVDASAAMIAAAPSTGVADPHRGDSENAHRRRQAAAKRST